MKKYISSLRLRTLPLALSGISVGSFWAIQNQSLDYYIVIGCILTTLFLQIVSNIANEIGDFIKGTDNSNRQGPQYGIQSGKISLKQLYNILYLFVCLTIISGILLVGYSFNWTFSHSLMIFILLGGASIVAALAYTLGKHPYGYLGLGDLFVFLFFGIISVFGAYYLQTKEFDYSLVFPAIIFGLWSIAVLNVNNIRDIENDKKSGKRTIVTFIGVAKARYYHYVLIILPLVLFLIIEIWLPLLLIPVWIYHLYQMSIKNGGKIDKQLPLVTLTTFCSAVLMIVFIVVSI